MTPAKRALLMVPVLGTAALMGAMLCADELVRMIARTAVAAPITLPDGAEIRESAALVGLLGFGAATGQADAVTVGRTILIRPALRHGSAHDWSNLIRHESVHVHQRLRYGRLYLPRYLTAYAWLWLRHGRAAHTYHPFELEAQRAVLHRRPDQSVKVPPSGPSY
jgi:hypothetical protein